MPALFTRMSSRPYCSSIWIAADGGAVGHIQAERSGLQALGPECVSGLIAPCLVARADQDHGLERAQLPCYLESDALIGPGD
jgi:hypothetical protein